MTENKVAENSGVGTATLAAKAGKYLTFALSKELYGLEILKVQEIIGIMKVTQVPKTPDFVRGVINLRGKVIPVMDLRVKFGLEKTDDTERTCVIVLQVSVKNQDLTMGTIVDEVSEVLEIAEEQIEEPPSFGSSVNVEFIKGMGKVEDKVIMLLDVDKVFTNDELKVVNRILK